MRSTASALVALLVLAGCATPRDDERRETLSPSSTTTLARSSSTVATTERPRSSSTTTDAPRPAATAPPPSTTAPSPPSTSAPTAAPTPTVVPGLSNRLLAAGDIASCALRGDELTARLLDRLAGTVVALGDLAYEKGTHEQFRECYHPTWGRHRDRTRPVPGNHDYVTPGGDGYHTYFPSAGAPDKGWYSYDLAGWHVVALNSNCGQVGCSAGSEQVDWLRQDLATSTAKCTVAYWHHARFSSGRHGSSTAVDAFWRALTEAGADVVLAAHDHNYERFAIIDGMRSFVVGTGGASLRPVGPPIPGSEARIASTHGVLVLTLDAGEYTWEFVDVDGHVRDSGSGACR